MWRSPGINLILRRALTPRPPFPHRHQTIAWGFHRHSSTTTDADNSMSQTEAKKLMRLAHVEALKDKLTAKDQEIISHDDLVQTCLAVGVAKSNDEASAFAKVLDDAGVVLLFRDKVYLHPDKVIDLIRKTLSLDDDEGADELQKLQETKEEIDALAHRQVRRVLWTGLGLAVMQAGLFFRLTFWEFSWDVMEPIAFFTTTAGIVTGYAYFMFTSRDPSYEDVLKRLFLSRQRKIIKNRGFDVHRFVELQKKHKLPLETDLLHGH